MKEIKLLIGEVKDRLAEIEKLMGEPKTLRTERIAIRLKDKREFKLLMQHFDEIGFMPKSESDGLAILGFPQTWQYRRNPYRPDERISIEQGYEIVDFDFFCAQKGITPPKFVMKSEDGVDLYEGDDFIECVNYCMSGNWTMLNPSKVKSSTSCRTHPKMWKAFSTKEAAEKWIEEHSIRPLLTTVDGADLYKGDNYYRSWYFQDRCNSINKWKVDYCRGLNNSHAVITGIDSAKAFSTEQAAESWANDNNKPKFTDVILFSKGHYALVYKDQIELNGDGVNFIIKPSDLEDMLHALKSL